jgi:type I restriction enzyme, S subunit
MSSEAGTVTEKGHDDQGLVPHLRFPEFRDAAEWEGRFGNLSFQTINVKRTDPALPVLAITQEHGAIPRDMIDYHVSVTEKSLENYKTVEKGDFIISLRSFEGGIEHSVYNGICSPAYIILRMNFDECGDFYRHYFKSRQFIKDLNRNLEGLRDGKMVSYAQFSELVLPTPPVQEQRKIAECLSSIDALIAVEKSKLAALRDHKKGLMQQLFPAKGETTPRLRFLSDGEWALKSLPEVAFFQEGPGIMAVDFCDEGLPLVRLSGVSGPSVTLDGCNYLDRSKVNQKWSHFRLELKDLVVSTSATFGLVSTVTDVAQGAVFYTGLIRFRPHDDRLYDGYLKAFLGSEPFARQVESAAVGGGIKHFGPTHLKQMEISIPPMAEQRLIAECLTSCDDMIDAQMRRLDAIFAHKTGLMQQLFPSPTGTTA